MDYLVRLFEVNGLAPGAHTLRATVAAKDAASTGNTVVVDLFQALNGTGMTSVVPVADTYVRNGTYAATNFGASTVMDVKLDGTSYQREAFLKFNVSGLTNTAGAKLQLVPISMNTDTAVTYTFELVSNDSWTETGTTWNTKPAGSGVVLGQVSGAALQVGVPFLLDVTSQVRSQAAGDGVLSIRISSETLGSLKQVAFGSREQANTVNRPKLLVQ
jgi:hyaluronate lyase